MGNEFGSTGESSEPVVGTRATASSASGQAPPSLDKVPSDAWAHGFDGRPVGPPSVANGMVADPRTVAPTFVTSTGAMAWWCMFFCYIPVVGGLVWIVVAVTTYQRERSNPFEPARLNARNGLNWLLTYTVVQIGLFALIAVVGISDSLGVGEESTAVLFVLLFYALMLIWGIMAIVTAIRGGIAAGRGEVYSPAYLIPFVRSA